MRITKKVKREIEEEITENIICNRCGNGCGDPPYMYEGLLEAHISGGFSSKIGDGIEYEFSLCEDCLIELFKTFKIQPEFVDTLWGSYYEEDEEKEAIKETNSQVISDPESNP